jgi:hypothetical protein
LAGQADEEPIEYAELGDEAEQLPQKKKYQNVIPLADAEDEVQDKTVDGSTQVDDLPWKAPSQDKVRDILSQLENE